jgi:hypothetical protein
VRIESSTPSQRELIGSNDTSVRSQAQNNPPRDTIESKSAAKNMGEFLAAIALFFAVGCAFLFLIFDFIRQWVNMRK